MAKEHIIYAGTSGINNKVDSARLHHDQETGLTELSKGVNISIDPTGRISKQMGYSTLLDGDYKLCPYDLGGYTVAMKGDALFTIDSDGNEKGIQSDMIGTRMDYEIASDGLNDICFYVNGYERGRILSREAGPWRQKEYKGPDTTQPLKGPPDKAHLLTLFNGRMYMAVDNALFVSQRRDYYNFVYKYAMQFRGRITLLQAMEGGIFVSDQKQVYFLPGQDVLADGDWQPLGLKPVSNSRAVEGCNEKMEAQYIGKGRGGFVICWYSQDGIFAGYDDGQTINLTKDKLSNKVPTTGNTYLPSATYGAMMNVNNERLILTLEP